MVAGIQKKPTPSHFVFFFSSWTAVIRTSNEEPDISVCIEPFLNESKVIEREKSQNWLGDEELRNL